VLLHPSLPCQCRYRGVSETQKSVASRHGASLLRGVRLMAAIQSSSVIPKHAE
jgi:hypothetical protein